MVKPYWAVQQPELRAVAGVAAAGLLAGGQAGAAPTKETYLVFAVATAAWLALAGRRRRARYEGVLRYGEAGHARAATSARIR